MPLLPHVGSVMNNGWTGALFLLLFMGFAAVFAVKGHYYVKRFKALNHGQSRVVSYDEVDQGRWVDNLLVGFVTLGFSLLVMAVLMRFKGFELGFARVLVLFCVVGGLLLVKAGLMSLLGRVFGFKENVFVYQYYIFVVLMGFLAVIVAAYSFFAGSDAGVVAMLWILFVLEVVGVFLMLVKNFFGGIDSLFYIFLYLCAVEILPILVGATMMFNLSI